MRYPITAAIGLALAVSACATVRTFSSSAPGRSGAQANMDSTICQRINQGRPDPSDEYIKCMTYRGYTVRENGGGVYPPTQQAYVPSRPAIPPVPSGPRQTAFGSGNPLAVMGKTFDPTNARHHLTQGEVEELIMGCRNIPHGFIPYSGNPPLVARCEAFEPTYMSCGLVKAFGGAKVSPDTFRRCLRDNYHGP